MKQIYLRYLVLAEALRQSHIDFSGIDETGKKLLETIAIKNAQGRPMVVTETMDLSDIASPSLLSRPPPTPSPIATPIPVKLIVETAMRRVISSIVTPSASRINPYPHRSSSRNCVGVSFVIFLKSLLKKYWSE
jgi:hypothetical protein